jgi:nucleotide-binding universal stress UspA family protein
MSRKAKNSAETKPVPPEHRRKFLVVIDETPECDRAVYFASRRAARTGGKLVMLAVPAVPGTQEWLGVGELMRAEAREEAERRLDEFAARARNLAGLDPERVVREGSKAEEIQKLIQEDREIAILVLAAGTSAEGPGPLVSSLAGAGSGSFPIPITIVPGHLGDAQLDALS